MRNCARPSPRLPVRPWPRSSATTTSGTPFPTRSSRAWPSSGCSACRSRKPTAEWAATPSRSAWPSRNWPGSIPRWPSPWRRLSAWAPCRCTCLGPASSATAGCRTCAPAPGGLRTRARLGKRDGATGGAWVIDGSKAFITNSGTDITSLVTVLAITGVTEGPHKELSSIIVPAGTPGFTVGQRYSKVGWCASDTRELSFADCCVPQDHLLGERGRGYSQFLHILDEGRVAIAALATGLAQGCVDECLRYAAEREAFGRRIGQF